MDCRGPSDVRSLSRHAADLCVFEGGWLRLGIFRPRCGACSLHLGIFRGIACWFDFQTGPFRLGLGILRGSLVVSHGALADTRTVAHGWAQTVTDAEGLTDPRSLGVGKAQADSEGLADTRTQAYDLASRRLARTLARTAPRTTESRCRSGIHEYRYGDSNPGFRRERAAS